MRWKYEIFLRTDRILVDVVIVGIMTHYWNDGYNIENVAHYWNGGYTIGMMTILLKKWLTIGMVDILLK